MNVIMLSVMNLNIAMARVLTLNVILLNVFLLNGGMSSFQGINCLLIKQVASFKYSSLLKNYLQGTQTLQLILIGNYLQK
jgi:hypothetical protein